MGSEMCIRDSHGLTKFPHGITVPHQITLHHHWGTNHCSRHLDALPRRPSGTVHSHRSHPRLLDCGKGSKATDASQHVTSRMNRKTMYQSLVPLHGHDICKEMYHGMHPTNGASPLTPKALILKLVPYAESVTHAPTQAKLQHAITGLINRTKRTDTTLTTDLALNNTACADPNTAAELKRWACLLYTSPSPRDLSTSRMPSSA